MFVLCPSLVNMSNRTCVQVRCTPDTIEGAISRITTQKLIQYQRGDARQIGRAIESLFGPALHPSL